MNKLLLTFLIFSFNAISKAQINEYDSIHDFSIQVNQIFENRMHQYANTIRDKREAAADLNDEEIFVSRNCEPASRNFLVDLTKMGITSQLAITRKHVYIEAKILVKGKKTDVVIDPTYRQFFSVAAARSMATESTMQEIATEVIHNMSTRVLVVETHKLRKTLETKYPVLPEWQVPMFSFPGSRMVSSYEDWFRDY